MKFFCLRFSARNAVHCGLLGLLLLAATICIAGGPRYVAGSANFNSGTMGTPITWAQGLITYYTDQGDLSTLLPHSSADAFVASAFSQWTSITTAAISSTLGGQLAEDVSGTNVAVNSDGSISMPADILPSALATPVGVVYDEDGSVTDALLGEGAGDAGSCFSNAVFGGPDNFSADAHIVHALIVLDGNCVQSASQEPDVQYRLVRVIGRIYGLDWSQTNINVLTGKPVATSADFIGFTIMHGSDPSFCTPISTCFPNASQPKMDDQAAISRLYPVTSQNQSQFSGKQIFSTATARIHGSVYFSGANGQPAQPMQGVNVVARWIDPSTGQPSRTYVAASVSGFLFTGNAGNPATGFNDSTGAPFSQFGSNDTSLEGFFDLAGLQLPSGSTGQYQLTVEAVDPLWSTQIGPYGPWQVEPSGTAQPITVNVTLGQDTEQDIVMAGSAKVLPDPFAATTYATPAPLPPSGEWNGSLGSYGETDYLWFSGQANSTLSVQVTALDETGAASQSKALPVIGLWGLSDPGTFPAPANTPSAFNTGLADTTQLNGLLLQSTNFRLGIFDLRGDGRPDYRYHARIFYGDTASPSRVPVSGGIAGIKGFGFHSNTSAVIAGTTATMLASSANQLLFATPAAPDGVQNVTLADATASLSSSMTGVITFGAGPNDTLTLVSGANPSVAVGEPAPVPIEVAVRGPDGSPVQGATIAFGSSPAASLSVCAGAASCSMTTDQSGSAVTDVTPLTAGVSTITAQLAPASYSSPQQVQTPLVGIASTSLDVSLTTPKIWVPQGVTLNVPLVTHVLTNGQAALGQTVHYSLTAGSGTFSASSVITDSNGNASVTLNLAAISSETDANACVTVGSVNRCSNLQVFPVSLASLQVQAVAGLNQTIAKSGTFAPVTVRVTDSASPPDVVLGAAVSFQSVIGRALNNQPLLWISNTGITQNPMPVVLSTYQTTVLSGVNGQATSQPSVGNVPGPVLILGSASIGSGSVQFILQSLP